MNQAGPPQHCKSVHSSSQGEGLDNVTHPAAVLAAQTTAAMAASAATEMTPQQRLQTPPPSGTCILPPAPPGYSYLYDRDGLKLWNPATRELQTVVMTTPQPPQQWIGTCPSREHATQVGNQALPAQSQAPLPKCDEPHTQQQLPPSMLQAPLPHHGSHQVQQPLQHHSNQVPQHRSGPFLQHGQLLKEAKHTDMPQPIPYKAPPPAPPQVLQQTTPQTQQVPMTQQLLSNRHNSFQ